MAVITKKDEKVALVVQSLPEGFNQDQFIEAFKAAYPKDWEKIVRAYNQHERKTKPGKTHPMPEPVQYLKNALNTYRASQVTRSNVVRDPTSDDLDAGFAAAMADDKA